jgi:hypothetical protein
MPPRRVCHEAAVVARKDVTEPASDTLTHFDPDANLANAWDDGERRPAQEARTRPRSAMPSRSAKASDEYAAKRATTAATAATPSPSEENSSCPGSPFSSSSIFRKRFPGFAAAPRAAPIALHSLVELARERRHAATRLLLAERREVDGREELHRMYVEALEDVTRAAILRPTVANIRIDFRAASWSSLHRLTLEPFVLEAEEMVLRATLIAQALDSHSTFVTEQRSLWEIRIAARHNVYMAVLRWWRTRVYKQHAEQRREEKQWRYQQENLAEIVTNAWLRLRHVRTAAPQRSVRQSAFQAMAMLEREASNEFCMLASACFIQRYTLSASAALASRLSGLQELYATAAVRYQRESQEQCAEHIRSMMGEELVHRYHAALQVHHIGTAFAVLQQAESFSRRRVESTAAVVFATLPAWADVIANLGARDGSASLLQRIGRRYLTGFQFARLRLPAMEATARARLTSSHLESTRTFVQQEISTARLLQLYRMVYLPHEAYLSRGRLATACGQDFLSDYEKIWADSFVQWWCAVSVPHRRGRPAAAVAFLQRVGRGCRTRATVARVCSLTRCESKKRCDILVQSTAERRVGFSASILTDHAVLAASVVTVGTESIERCGLEAAGLKLASAVKLLRCVGRGATSRRRIALVWSVTLRSEPSHRLKLLADQLTSIEAVQRESMVDLWATEERAMGRGFATRAAVLIRHVQGALLAHETAERATVQEAFHRWAALATLEACAMVQTAVRLAALACHRDEQHEDNVAHSSASRALQSVAAQAEALLAAHETYGTNLVTESATSTTVLQLLLDKDTSAVRQVEQHQRQQQVSITETSTPDSPFSDVSDEAKSRDDDDDDDDDDDESVDSLQYTDTAWV